MGFAERFERYLNDVERAHTEPTKAFLFLEFIRSIFSEADVRPINKLFPYLEEYLKKEGTLVIRGRADALLGNLIIEFKVKLDAERLSDAKEELKRYISIIWSREKEKVRYLLLASDGIETIVYRPRLFKVRLFQDGNKTFDITPENIGLEKIDEIRLDSVEANYAYIWLDRYILYRELLPPSTESFLETFGKDTPVYNQSFGMLKDRWDGVQTKPNVEVLFREWSKYLEVVYGSKMGEEDLFLRHTYLATLSKLIAYMFYSGGALPSPQEILSVLSGEAFREWGIQNFLEKDFFTWIVRVGEDFGTNYSRYLIEHLRSFDITKLDEDVLKGLYQELVDPEERHDLGEYYTPDWLADYITQEVLDDPYKSLLDPACGSGTFLVSAIKLKKAKLMEGGKSETEILKHILSHVVGVDVHPLAIITTKVNYLLALGNLIQYKEKGEFIPVYLADSIKLPEYKKILEGVDVYSIETDKENLQVPSKVAESSEMADRVLDIIRQLVETEFDSQNIDTYIKSRLPGTNLDGKDFRVLGMLLERLRRFHKKGRDTIWTFILKNIYKPIFLKERKFDCLIGNPPWISYRFFGTDYQKFVKDQVIEKYKLLPKDKVELMTHMEFATLFFARGVDLYLNQDGCIGFVMPRGIFVSDQHDNFRKNTFNPKVKIERLFDLEKVSPLFNINACVVFGRKGQETQYPIPVKEFEGTLPRKNATLIEAKEALKEKEKKLYLNQIGDRSFWLDKEIEISLAGSYYQKSFRQGASLVPRNFWFVDITKHPVLGINPKRPRVKTSKTILTYAKEPYRNVLIEGNVERQFLYATLRGSEVAPFLHLPFLITVLPVLKTQELFRMVSEREAERAGYDGLYEWIEIAERNWRRIRGEKAEANTAVEWLNYRNKLVSQNHKIRFKVLYLTSGTHIAACLFDKQKQDLEVNIDGTKIPLNGFIAEHKTYYYETNNENEARYLVAVLNASIVDDLIKGMQSRGLFGPRDIHKKVLELPIPKFNPSNPAHKELSELGKKCKEKAEKTLPRLMKKYKSIAYIRRGIKGELAKEMEKISELVLQIFSQRIEKNTLDKWK